MNLKKILALLMATTLTVSAFSACSAPEEESSSSESSTSSSSESEESSEATDDFNMDGDIQLNLPGEFPIVIGEPVTFSIFTAPHTDSSALLDSADNTATAWFEEKVNCNIDWTIVTSADKTAKLNLLFQSNSYEDVIFGTYWDGATQYSYGTQGYILPLNDYLDSDDAYWWNLFKEEVFQVEGQFTQSDLDELVMPDGNVYSLVSGGSQAYHSGVSYRMYIYEPWLDTLGLDMPTTTDEFYDVLTAFKTQDPNGNGIADEIPLTGSYTDGWNADPLVFLMNSFVYFDKTTKYYADDGEIVLAYMEDAFKDGVDYIATLYSEGLLDSEYFTQDATLMRSKATQETQYVGVAAGGNENVFSVRTIGTEGDWTNWTAIAPLEGPDGVQYAKYNEPTPEVKGHITDNCENVKTVFRILDSLYNLEIGMNLYCGYDGVNEFYEIYDEDTDVIAINGEAAKYVRLNYNTDEVFLNVAWEQIAPYSGLGAGWHSYQALQTEDPALDGETRSYAWAEMYYPYIPEDDVIPPSFIFTEEDSEDVVDYSTGLNNYFDQQYAYMVTNDNVEEYWDEFIAGCENLGSAELLELYQTAYEERMAVIGG